VIVKKIGQLLEHLLKIHYDNTILLYAAIKYYGLFTLYTGMFCFCVLQNFREKNRASKFFNNLSAVSEAIPALGWVSVVSSLRSFCNVFNKI